MFAVTGLKQGIDRFLLHQRRMLVFDRLEQLFSAMKLGNILPIAEFRVFLQLLFQNFHRHFHIPRSGMRRRVFLATMKLILYSDT